jgi:hypothetical protein
MNKQLSNHAGRSANSGGESYQRVQAPQGGVHERYAAIIGIVAVGVLTVVGLAAVIMRQHQTPVSSRQYPAVDRVPCQSSDPSGMHIHAHVTIYLNGKRIPIPQSIGIAPDGSCLYWLHTHDASGIIHIEAPRGSSFTLGTFLDIWGQQFQQLGYPRQLSDPDGWYPYVDGKLVSSGMRSIPLVSHTLITLAYNSPGVTPDTNYPWDDL